MTHISKTPCAYAITNVAKEQINFVAARQHIELLTGNADAPITTVAIRLNSLLNDSVVDTKRGTLAELETWIAAQQSEGAGIYVTVNQTVGVKRRKGDVTEARAVWVDDDVPRPTARTDWPLMPHLTVETSPGKFHYYWMTQTKPGAEFDGVMECMVKNHGNDSNAKDISRVLRLAGTFNLKNPSSPHRVTIVSATKTPRYKWADVLAAFPPLLAADGTLQKPKLDVLDAMAILQTGALGMHDASIKLASRLASKGLDGAEILQYLRGMILSGDAADRTDRLHELPGIVDSALAKFATGGFNDILEKAKADTLRYKLLGSREIRQLPALAWRVRGVLPKAGLAAIYGPSASGKSFLAFDLAAAIASGERWFDCRVHAASVVYVVLEGEAGFKLRAAAWEMSRCRTLDADMHLVLQPFALTQPQDVADLAAAIPSGAVVFIDTLNRAAPTADENSSRDMGQILEAAKALQGLTGGLVVLVHHTGKDTTKGLRGHSSLFAAMDAAIEVSRELSREGDHREWKVAKSKDGRDGQAQGFCLDIVSLGLDEDNEELTSCVISPTGPVTRSKALTVSQGVAMDALMKSLSDDLFGESVHRDVWREAFYQASAGSMDSKRRAFNRGVNDLVAHGRVTHANHMFSVPAI